MFDAGSALNNADTTPVHYDRPSMALWHMLLLQPNFQGTFDEANLFCELSSHWAGFQAVWGEQHVVGWASGQSRTSVWSPNLLERAVVLQCLAPSFSNFQGNRGTIQHYSFHSFFFYHAHKPLQRSMQHWVQRTVMSHGFLSPVTSRVLDINNESGRSSSSVWKPALTVFFFNFYPLWLKSFPLCFRATPTGACLCRWKDQVFYRGHVFWHLTIAVEEKKRSLGSWVGLKQPEG